MGVTDLFVGAGSQPGSTAHPKPRGFMMVICFTNLIRQIMVVMFVGPLLFTSYLDAMRYLVCFFYVLVDGWHVCLVPKFVVDIGVYLCSFGQNLKRLCRPNHATGGAQQCNLVMTHDCIFSGGWLVPVTIGQISKAGCVLCMHCV